MEAALENARESLERKEVPVGCVFVYEGKVLARGSNQTNETKNATRHAELVCVDAVLEHCKANQLDWKLVFREISVFVTVEPCIMCAAALHQMGIKEVVFGCRNDRFGGTTVLNVFELLKSTIKISGGIREAEAMELLKKFYEGKNPTAPVPNKKRKKQQ